MLLGETTAAVASSHWLDWVSRGLALAAFLVSWLSFRRGKAVDRRNVFIEIHRHLLEPDIVAARRRLYKFKSLDEVERFARTDDAGMTHVYRLFALFDLIGYYAESKWV